MYNVTMQLSKWLEEVDSYYYKLLLIVGKHNSGKTILLNKLASEKEVKVLNLNLVLSKKLLEYSVKQRPLVVAELLNELVPQNGELCIIDNIEVLFDITLQQNPMKLLQSISRNATVISSWNGKLIGNHITYANIGHKEYKSFEIKDIEIITTNAIIN